MIIRNAGAPLEKRSAQDASNPGALETLRVGISAPANPSSAKHAVAGHALPAKPAAERLGRAIRVAAGVGKASMIQSATSIADQIATRIALRPDAVSRSVNSALELGLPVRNPCTVSQPSLRRYCS